MSKRATNEQSNVHKGFSPFFFWKRIQMGTKKIKVKFIHKL